MNKKLSNWWWRDAGLDPGFSAIAARGDAYTIPSAVVITAQNKFYKNTKSVIELLNICYIFANGAAGAENWKLLNWAENSNTFNADYPTVITHSPAGVKGNAADQYISTNWNPSTNGAGKYSLNSACRGMWVYTIAATVTLMDGTLTTGSRNCSRNQSSSSLHRINQGSSNLAGALDFSGTGYMAIDRSSDTIVSGYNRLVKTDTTATSVSVISEEQVIFKNAAVFGDMVASLYFTGPHLTEAQHNLFAANFQTYLTEIGL